MAPHRNRPGRPVPGRWGTARASPRPHVHSSSPWGGQGRNPPPVRMDRRGTPAPRTLGAGSVLPELIAVVEGSRGAWGHGGAACALVRRVAAAAARRGETDPRRAGGGGRTVPAVDQ